VGLVNQALSTDNLSSKSQLSILILGSEATANEPWPLAKYHIPKTTRALEGRQADERRRQELLQDAVEKCRTNMSPTFRSPIFLGVKQAVAELRAEGCKPTGHCKMLIDTDGEENVELAVRDRLNGAGKRRALPPALDNSGIQIAFCGLAVTAGKLVEPSGREIRKVAPRDPGREDRLQEVWRSLFTKQELVTFEPFCPKSNISLQGLETAKSDN
jgi:hypothetical protein